jgi:hypothetical protein
MLFKKGDSVKVKKNVSIPDMEEFDFTDWQGRIIDFIESDEQKGEFLLEVEWDSITLKNMPSEYIEKNLDEGYDIETMIFEQEDVEKTKVRDKVQDRFAILKSIEIPLDDEEKFISKILDTKKLDVSVPNLRKFLVYIKSEITYPCILAGIESMGDFGWEEKYEFGYGSKKEYEALQKTKPSLQDEFELLDFIDEDIAAWHTIPVKVKRLSDNKIFTLCLDGLKPVYEASHNFKILDAFVVWFVNY